VVSPESARGLVQSVQRVFLRPATGQADNRAEVTPRPARPPVVARSPLTTMRSAHVDGFDGDVRLLRLSRSVVPSGLTETWEANGKV
jgi:hypothetical protein